MSFKIQNSLFKIISTVGMRAVVRISLINPMNIALKERQMRLVRSAGKGIFYHRLRQTFEMTNYLNSHELICLWANRFYFGREILRYIL